MTCYTTNLRFRPLAAGRTVANSAMLLDGKDYMCMHPIRFSSVYSSITTIRYYDIESDFCARFIELYSSFLITHGALKSSCVSMK